MIPTQLRMRRIIGILFAVASLLGGTAAAAFAALDRPQIVNGLDTWEYPAAGILLKGGSPLSASLTCSGTLIGCSTFITASHCVCETLGDDCQPGDAGEPRGSDFMVFFQHSGFHEVSSIEVHPDYDFPTADVAVVHLAAPVTGITPMPINTTATPPAGSAATIVGFGRSGGSAYDYGLKRQGDVSTVGCGTPTLVCWNFANPIGTSGEDSNTCNGDSGGPLFWHDGGEDVLAGITSGGNAEDCLPLDESYDANVFHYRSWITGKTGGDLGGEACGAFAPVGSAPTAVATFAGTLSSGAPQSHRSFEVPAGTSVLRVTMNASDPGGVDFDLYVRHGAQASSSTFDCKHDGSNQVASCEFANPAAGTWWLLVQRYSGSGSFQATATVFGDDALELAPRTTLLCGSPSVLTGSGFTAGSVIKAFIATPTGVQAFGPYDPTSWTPTSLTWTLPCSVGLGNGFIALQVINTDQGYRSSNIVPALLRAGTGSGYPSITGINGVTVTAAHASFPLAHVQTVVAKGSTITINGTGFAVPAKVNLFSASGNSGPLDTLAGSTSTTLLVQIPLAAPTGPGALQVVNPNGVWPASNAVSVPLGAVLSITSISQAGSTLTVNGSGFSARSVINFFTPGANHCGMAAGTAVCPLTLVSDQQFTVQRPVGAGAGRAFIEVLNPPFIPFSSTGTDPDGAFTLS